MILLYFNCSYESCKRCEETVGKCTETWRRNTKLT